MVALALAVPVLAAFRSAPYTYGGTHFAGRSIGGPTGAFRYYNGGSSHVCCSDIPIQRTGKPIDEIVCRQERGSCSPAESPGIINKAKHEDPERAVVGSGPESDGQSPGVRAP